LDTPKAAGQKDKTYLSLSAAPLSLAHITALRIRVVFTEAAHAAQAGPQPAE